MRRVLKALWRILTAPFRFLAWILRGIGHAIQAIHNFFTAEIEENPMVDAISTSIEHPSALLVHFEAIRNHLLRIIIYMILTTSISFLFITPILEFLSQPLEGGLASLQAIDVTEGVGTVMRVALLSGFALAFPLIAFEIWLFIAAGLHPRERISSLLAIPVAALFFLSGMAFAYKFMLPTALPLLLNFMGIETIPRPNSYFPFIVNLLFWLGVSFEFPLVIFFLARLGIVNARALANQWRLAIVIIAVLAAVITTTTDPANMALVMLPMTLLYFISIGLAWIAHRPRRESF